MDLLSRAVGFSRASQPHHSALSTGSVLLHALRRRWRGAPGGEATTSWATASCCRPSEPSHPRPWHPTTLCTLRRALEQQAPNSLLPFSPLLMTCVLRLPRCRFENPQDAFSIIKAGPEPLVSHFTVSYGLVLNLLSIYSLEQARQFCNRSFGVYQRVRASCLCARCSRLSCECTSQAGQGEVLGAQPACAAALAAPRCALESASRGKGARPPSRCWCLRLTWRARQLPQQEGNARRQKEVQELEARISAINNEFAATASTTTKALTVRSDAPRSMPARNPLLPALSPPRAHPSLSTQRKRTPVAATLSLWRCPSAVTSVWWRVRACVRAWCRRRSRRPRSSCARRARRWRATAAGRPRRRCSAWASRARCGAVR